MNTPTPLTRARVGTTVYGKGAIRFVLAGGERSGFSRLVVGFTVISAPAACLADLFFYLLVLGESQFHSPKGSAVNGGVGSSTSLLGFASFIPPPF